MPRYRLLLEYDGGPFQGWQKQANGPSVQSAIENAVNAMLGEQATLVAAGRTDAGVHALAMTAHLDLQRDLVPERLRDGLNHHLRPAPVVVLQAARTDPQFHARFDCLGRSYLYRILNRRAPSVLEAGRAWHVALHLDAERMHAAGQALIGKHDFTSYRSSECQAASPDKTLDRLIVARAGEQLFVRVHARSFLHHQVRNIVGTLKLIGAGKKPVSFARDALEACDRAAAGPTAPPQGLYFVKADYPMTAPAV